MQVVKKSEVSTSVESQMGPLLLSHVPSSLLYPIPLVLADHVQSQDM